MLLCTLVLSLPAHPSGVDEQVSVSFSQGKSASSAQLDYTDTGQLVPANSTRVQNRFYPDTALVLSAPINSNRKYKI